MPTANRTIWMGAVVAVWFLAVVSHVRAARPLVVDNADPVEDGRVQIEFGAELETSANLKALATPFKVSFGLTRWLEMGIEPSVLYIDDEEASPRRVAGMGDLVLEAKARLPIDLLGVAFAISPSLKIPTADERRGLGTGEADATLLLIGTRAFTKDQQLHFNVSYTVTGKVRSERLQDVLFVGIAGETTISGLATDQFQVVAEVFGTTKEEADGRGDIQGRVGARYRPVADLILDAAVGRSLTARPEVQLFATVGLTWVFTAPWNKAR